MQRKSTRATIVGGLALLAVAGMTACGGGGDAPRNWDAGVAAWQVEYDAQQTAREQGMPEGAVGDVTCRDRGYDQAGWHVFNCKVPVLGTVGAIRLRGDAEGYRLETLGK